MLDPADSTEQTDFDPLIMRGRERMAGSFTWRYRIFNFGDSRVRGNHLNRWYRLWNHRIQAWAIRQNWYGWWVRRQILPSMVHNGWQCSDSWNDDWGKQCCQHRVWLVYKVLFAGWNFMVHWYSISCWLLETDCPNLWRFHSSFKDHQVWCKWRTPKWIWGWLIYSIYGRVWGPICPSR